MLILVRYGEIGLKSSQVKKKFVQRLVERLEEKLSYLEIGGEVLRSEGRIFADVPEEDAADASLGLSRVPGVVSVSPVEKTSLELGEMCEKAVELLEGREEETFAVDARRAGEHDYTSKDIEEVVGQEIVDGLGLEVDLDDPGVTVHIEARYASAYVYTEVLDGVGGLPVNEGSPVAVLMEDSTNPEDSVDVSSSPPDDDRETSEQDVSTVKSPISSNRASTVAAFLLMKRGCKVFPVYTGQEQERLEDDIRALRQFDPGVKLTVMKGSEAGDALEEVRSLYRCKAVAFPHTSSEVDRIDVDIDAELLFPNSGLSSEEVLERYRSLIVPEGEPV